MKEGYSDGDIKFLGHDDPNKTICQICSLDLTTMHVADRNIHYNCHFSEQTEASSYGSRPGKPMSSSLLKPASSLLKPSSKSKGGFKLASFLTKSVPVEQQNVFWRSSLTTPPPENFTPGLISVLRRALTKSHDKGTTQKAWLASEHAVHIGKEGWDRMWGCGYRNYLMACAALMDQPRQPVYFTLLDSGAPPGIRNLQELLEEAWRNGFDKEGAKQLDHRLVGTQKWIGTTDLYVAFTYRGIPAQLVDLTDLRKDVKLLLQWIYDYFSGGDPQLKGATVDEALRGAQAVVVTDKLPIILQHKSHSCTIVGCERAKNGSINLLAFDPSKRVPSYIREVALHDHNPERSQGVVSSPSKVFNKVIHPMKTSKSRKRKSLEPNSKHSPVKRKRPSDPTSRHDGEVIVNGSSSEHEDGGQPAGPSSVTPLRELDANDVLKHFRITARSLEWKNKDKYQILYLPLEDPLTDRGDER
ncbi:peptidase family C78-domain-containing protein [Trametes polyzona]|nr:peptidase family C78-domain-containing protein [Trametes polyzona]